MNTGANQGVFICQGGSHHPDSLDLKKLRWTAEAGSAGPVMEVTQACQTQGAKHLASVVKQAGLDTFILGACPLAGPSGALGRALTEQGLDPSMMQVLDVCRKPEGGLGPCLVAAGAQRSLCQALAANREMEAPQSTVLAVSTRVLVVGDGLPALSMVLHLDHAGYSVLLLAPTKRLAPPDYLLGPEAMQEALGLAQTVESLGNVELALGAKLLELAGTAGDFTARYLDREGEIRSSRVGAAVVCQGPPGMLNTTGLGINGSQVWSLHGLLGLLESPAHLTEILSGSDHPRVGFMVGLAKESGAMSLRAALRGGLQIIAMGGEATLFAGNAKVAARELEELMRQAREAGMLQVKFTRPQLELSHNQGISTVTYRDEVLGLKLEQEFDIVAFDQTPSPNEAYHDLAAALGLAVGGDGRLQPDRMAALPTAAGRGGVFAVGPSRGDWDVDSWPDEVAQAAWSIAGLLAHGEVEVPASVVKVDRSRCALCLTCVRVCPQGAMTKIDRRPVANPLVCTACGTCASECPMDAIQILGQEDERYQAQIKAALAPDSDASGALKRELLVLLCANSAGAALAAARLRGLPLPDSARFVQVPCVGKLDPAMVLSALAQGFDAVLVVACHSGACHSLDGEAWAGLRIEHLKRLLAETGYDPGRLILGRVQASQAGRLADMIGEAADALETFGENPLRQGARVRSHLNRYTVETDECYTLL